MKVLQINAVYGVGSTGVIVKDIHELALANGIDSYVAYSVASKDSGLIPNGYQIGHGIGKKVHALLYRINGMQGYFSRFSTYRLLRYMKTIKPDVVQLHNMHSNYVHLNLLLKFLAKEKIKTVLTLHDCWFYTGGCFHYTAVGCDRWLDSCGNCPKKKTDLKAMVFDRTAKILKDRKKFMDAIENLTVVGVSKWIADEAGKTFLKDKRILTIHNGVNTEQYQPTPSEIREKYGIKDKFVILGLASKFLAPVNKETLQKVAASLADDEVLLLLGCKEEQKENLPGRVIPLPYIKDRETLCGIYSLADVFVNCTREESFSLVNVEAQACGTPVITYQNTGAKETVDNQCGFSIENGNAEALVSKIRTVRNMEKASLTQKCRKWVVEQFDKEENYRKYLTLFAEI